jgi:signal transduction histidine kinase
LEVVGGGGVWPVEVDPAELESALLKLAVNARDAMPQGGKLTIEASNAYLDEAYCANHPDVRPGQYAMIALTDISIS